MKVDLRPGAEERVECIDCEIMFTPAKPWHKKCSDCIKVPYQTDDDEDEAYGSEYHEVKF